MKPRFMAVLFIAGLLVISAQAEDSSSTKSSDVLVGTHHTYPESSSINSEGRIEVNVWSSVPAADSDKLSAAFSRAALTATFRMQSTERSVEQCIRKGFPLGEFWIQAQLNSIDESLTQAEVSATNDADRQALQQLHSQNTRLRLWTDWLIQQNRNLALANYYMSASALDNDEQFQSNVACTNSLLSMLASRTFAENYSCR